MSKNLTQILAAADWKELTPRLLNYGNDLISNCFWRGLPVTVGRDSKLCVEGYGADDFLQEALERFSTGRRKYDQSLPLDQNLKGAIRSMIWSANKSSIRTHLTDISLGKDVGGDPFDRLTGPSITAYETISAEELATKQQRLLDEFEKSLVGEKDLMALLTAYKSEQYKPRDVEKVTGIPATRVSELKRKLQARIRQFEAYTVRRRNE